MSDRQEQVLSALKIVNAVNVLTPRKPLLETVLGLESSGLIPESSKKDFEKLKSYLKTVSKINNQRTIRRKFESK